MLSEHEALVFFLQLALLLGCARALGELARRFRRPAILGEILAGVLLGPTVLGELGPELFAWLFPSVGATAVYRSAVTLVAVVLFLLVAGMEIDLSSVWRQGKNAIVVSVVGIAAPFVAGFLLGAILPARWVPDPSRPWTFALFLGTAMSISALPVIAKTLLDLNLLRTEIGSLIMAAAMLDDLSGWLIFSIILGLLSGDSTGLGPVVMHLGATLLLVAFCLTFGRKLVDRLLPWVLTRLPKPGGILTLTVLAAFTGAAVSEALGIHAVFGAFIVGIMIGESAALREQAREMIHQFVMNVFSPLFFAAIGIRVNFIAHFDATLVLVVLAIAFIGKIGGCVTAGRWLGMPSREAWAIGFGMNSRGAMEIILAQLAREYGLIDERFFVALVVMALATSLTSGPMINWLVGRVRPKSLADLVREAVFLPRLEGRNKGEIIHEISLALAPVARVSPVALTEAVLRRESLMGTGLGQGLALPHAHLPGLAGAHLAIGRSMGGIDFDAPDGEPARLILLLITPEEDPTGHVQILAGLARWFGTPAVRAILVEAESRDAALQVLETVPCHEPGREQIPIDRE